MGLMGVNSLLIFGFSIIILLFFVGLITPLFGGLVTEISRIVGADGVQKMANAITDTLYQASTSEGKIVKNAYSLYLGEGYYYVGVWQGNTLNGVCPAGAFCVVYFAPVNNATAVVNAVKTGNVTNLTLVKGVIAFYRAGTGGYYVTEFNGDSISKNIGVLFYVNGIRRVTIIITAEQNGGEYYLNFAPVSGIDFSQTVKK